MPVELLAPILDGIRHTHFFEGRILSGRDLREEQEAQRSHRWNLGRAIGTGIVEGLEVSVASAAVADPVVKVTCGLALDRKGQMLHLPHDVEVALTPTQQPVPDDAGVFRNCVEVLNTLVPSGVGLYLLIMSPASGYLEEAPKSGIGDGGKIAGCGKRYEVEGVVFRLEMLAPSALGGVPQAVRDEVQALIGHTDLERNHLLRNRAAHLCLGTDALTEELEAPLATVSGVSEHAAYGALDDLRGLQVLGDCDVPLAIFHWTTEGIKFLDLWSVRRRPHAASPSDRWPAQVASRRLAEGEAAFLQFQSQLDDLRAAHPDPDSIVAASYFRYLPAAGVYTAGQGGSPIQLAHVFLGDRPTRGPELVDAARLRSLFEISFEQRAIDLELEPEAAPGEDPRPREMVWLYEPWQHRRAIESQPAAERLVVFASPHLPYLANARFDVARWEYSNYARLGNAGW